MQNSFLYIPLLSVALFGKQLNIEFSNLTKGIDQKCDQYIIFQVYRALCRIEFIRPCQLCVDLQMICWRSLCPYIGQYLFQHNANATVVIVIIIASRGYFQKSDTNTIYMFLSPDVLSTCTKLEPNVVYINSQRPFKSLSDEANSRQPKTQVRREELEM